MSVVAPESYVEVAEVSKIYRSGTADAVEAVSSVSFTVPRGQFVAILGPSGCGKSTLLMMLGGLEALTAGRITVDGMPMSGPRTSIGVMFQDSTLLPWKSDPGAETAARCLSRWCAGAARTGRPARFCAQEAA